MRLRLVTILVRPRHKVRVGICGQHSAQMIRYYHPEPDEYPRLTYGSFSDDLPARFCAACSVERSGVLPKFADLMDQVDGNSEAIEKENSARLILAMANRASRWHRPGKALRRGRHDG